MHPGRLGGAMQPVRTTLHDPDTGTFEPPDVGRCVGTPLRGCIVLPEGSYGGYGFLP